MLPSAIDEIGTAFFTNELSLSLKGSDAKYVVLK